jgi:HEAT repeat protein
MPIMAPDDFQHQWRERLASGSKLAAKALAQALKDDPSRLASIVPLVRDPVATVRVSTLRALHEVSISQPRVVAPFARELIEALAAPEPDAQESALGALSHVAHHAQAEAALALPLIAELLHAKRPHLREEAARCLGKLGIEVPPVAATAARRLVDALQGARSPRAAQEVREILAALEGLVPNLPEMERAALAPSIAPLRGHPNIQVRERAGRLARQLSG